VRCVGFSEKGVPVHVVLQGGGGGLWVQLERKIVKRNAGPVKENILWRIRTGQDLMNLCRGIGTIWETRKGRLCGLGHVEKM
jgi:hypothetical protein